MKLTTAQKKHLRGLGHDLKPLIIVSESGATESLLAEFEATLSHHELIKVSVRVSDRKTRDAIIEKLCIVAAAVLVQRVGNMALLYRQNPKKKKKIVIPNR